MDDSRPVGVIVDYRNHQWFAGLNWEGIGHGGPTNHGLYEVSKQHGCVIVCCCLVFLYRYFSFIPPSFTDSFYFFQTFWPALIK